MLKILSKIFAKKSPVDQLYDQHQSLLKEAHALSTSNRKASDAKYLEAEEVMKRIEALESEVK